MLKLLTVDDKFTAFLPFAVKKDGSLCDAVFGKVQIHSYVSWIYMRCVYFTYTRCYNNDYHKKKKLVNLIVLNIHASTKSLICYDDDYFVIVSFM